MSYNISSFNVRRIDNLTVDAIDLLRSGTDITFSHDDEEASPFHGLYKNLNGSITGSDGECHGHIDGNKFVFDRVNCRGDFSGYDIDNLLDLLSKSTGILEVIVVWEGGDTIERITITDGKVIREEIG